MLEGPTREIIALLDAACFQHLTLEECKIIGLANMIEHETFVELLVEAVAKAEPILLDKFAQEALRCAREILDDVGLKAEGV